MPGNAASTAGIVYATATGLILPTFVTGAAGFIGSNLADRLHRRWRSGCRYDNFSTGMPEIYRVYKTTIGISTLFPRRSSRYT